MNSDMILTLQDDQGNIIGYTTDPTMGINVSSEDPKYIKFLQEEDARRAVAALDSFRFIRNNLLKDSDWTDLPNSPVKNKEAWLTYRQALRDLPQNFSEPSEVVWPIKPE